MKFLLYDSGPDTQRMLIFGTQRNLEMLKLAEHWLADGTFKTAPPLFSQVYVVHALRGGTQLMRDGHLLPSLFVLLPNKTEATYRRMWEQIRLKCPLAQPKEMLLDFEKAAINSRCGRRQWSSAASFTSHRTCGARCRLRACKQTTARTRSSLYASDSYLLSRLLTLMMYMSCLVR